MARMSDLGKNVAVLMLLFGALLISDIHACNSHQRFNKQDRYYRRHNYRRYFGKRSAEYMEKPEEAQEKYEFPILNTTCGAALCDSTVNYPHEAISKAVKQLRQLYESKKVPFTEEVDHIVMTFLTQQLGSDESDMDTPDIVYEETKGCKAFGNASFPQEGFSKDDGKIYFVVNVPEFPQKTNKSTCKSSKMECGSSDVKLPSTYYQTCLQVHRDEMFLVVPRDSSSSSSRQYGVNDFRVRTFVVPDGCKCVLLRTDIAFLEDD